MDGNSNSSNATAVERQCYSLPNATCMLEAETDRTSVTLSRLLVCELAAQAVLVTTKDIGVALANETIWITRVKGLSISFNDKTIMTIRRNTRLDDDSVLFISPS